MKNKLLLIILFIATVLSGCNKVSEDSSFIEGQEKLESHQYDEALKLLSQVLDDDPENESARAMYMQARKMKSAQEYENNLNYNKAIKELECIVNINNGSKKIKRESINKKSELEQLKQIAEKEALERKENAKKVSKQNVNKIDKQIISNNKQNKEEAKQEEQEVIEEQEDNKEEINEHSTTEQVDDKEDNTDNIEQLSTDKEYEEENTEEASDNKEVIDNKKEKTEIDT